MRRAERAPMPSCLASLITLHVSVEHFCHQQYQCPVLKHCQYVSRAVYHHKHAPRSNPCIRKQPHSMLLRARVRTHLENMLGRVAPDPKADLGAAQGRHGRGAGRVRWLDCAPCSTGAGRTVQRRILVSAWPCAMFSVLTACIITIQKSDGTS